MSDIQLEAGTISAVLFCDDARKEITGKDIIIGVYPSDMVAAEFPAFIRISVWFRFLPAKLGKNRISVRIRYQEQVAPTLTLEFDVHTLGLAVGVATPPLQLMINNPMQLEFEVLDGDNFRSLASLPVKAAHTAPPSSNELPLTFA
jgi:hypothetical protein